MRGGTDEGQATVELALVLPLVAGLLLLVVQVGLLARDQILVVHAAREAARAAAVDPDPDAASRAASASGTLLAHRTSVRVLARDGPGGQVRVVVRYLAPTALPLVGSLLGDVPLEGAATMRVEQ